ncbi:MAG: hypothetical protein ABJC09_09370 [Terriglobia bacterium]
MLDRHINSNELAEMLPDFLVAARNPYSLQVSIMDRNDRLHYDKFCDGIINCLKPANGLETQLAFSIASDYWRLNRTRNIEDGIFASSHPNPTSEFGPTPIDKQIAASQTSAFLCRQSDFRFLSTWEMRIQRTLNRNKAELRQLQVERRKFESQQPDLGPVFKAHHQSGLIPTNPETQGDTSGQGFAFSETPEPSEPAPAEGVTDAPAQVRTAANQTAASPVKESVVANGFAFNPAALGQLADKSGEAGKNIDNPKLGNS